MPITREQAAQLAPRLAMLPIPSLDGDRIDYVRFGRQQALEQLAQICTLDGPPQAAQESKELRKRPRKDPAKSEPEKETQQRPIDVPLSPDDVTAVG